MPVGMTRQEFEKAVKKALKATGGSVRNAAAILGIHETRLSSALQHRSLWPWWSRYKEQISTERRRARARRAYYQKKLRALLESGYDLATAEALAGQDRRRRVGLRAPTLGQGAPTIYLPALPEEG
jgi:hypothetical protein